MGPGLGELAASHDGVPLRLLTRVTKVRVCLGESVEHRFPVTSGGLPVLF